MKLITIKTRYFLRGIKAKACLDLIRKTKNLSISRRFAFCHLVRHRDVQHFSFNSSASHAYVSVYFIKQTSAHQAGLFNSIK